jgi:hypothetical protein
MKRFKVFSLCVFAVFAFGVLAATSAEAKKKETGDLVLESSNGESELGNTIGVFLHATNSDGTGIFKSATKGTANSVFHNVSVVGSPFKCRSAGEEAGNVKIEELNEELVWINKAKQEAGVVFTPHSGEFLAQFECENVGKVKVRGAVIGHTSPNNVESVSSKLDLLRKSTSGQEPEADEAKLAACEAQEKAHPTPTKKTEWSECQNLWSEVSSKPGEESNSAQEQPNIHVTNHGNSTVCKLAKGKEKCKPGQAETNTINGPTPEAGRCHKAVPKKSGRYTDANCSMEEAAHKGNFEFEPVT